MVPLRVAVRVAALVVKVSPATVVRVVAGSAAVVSVKVGVVQPTVVVALVLAEVLMSATMSVSAVR